MATKKSELEEEYRKIQRNFRVIGVVALFVLTAGATFFHFVEDLGWLDAFYFSTITLTTVGYGDITPQTNAGKLFDIFYIILGIGILATFANLLIKNAAARRELKQFARKPKKD